MEKLKFEIFAQANIFNFLAFKSTLHEYCILFWIAVLFI